MEIRRGIVPEREFNIERRSALAILAGIVLLVSDCRGKHNRASVENEEPAEGGPRLASSLKMNDPSAPAQLLHGFYGIEGGAWRWTAGKFSVLLRCPLGSAQRGATLKLAINVPDVVIQKTGGFTLAASVGPQKLGSERYSKAGSYVFSADLPPEQLTKETVTIDFTLDKSIPAGSVDRRELGVIALSAGLESK